MPCSDYWQIEYMFTAMKQAVASTCPETVARLAHACQVDSPI